MGGLHPPDEALGRSRGGLTSKVHLRCEGGGHPVAALVTAGQAHENPLLPALMEVGAVKRPGGPGRPRIRPHRVVGDKWWATSGTRTPTPGPTCAVVGPGRGSRASPISAATRGSTAKPTGCVTGWSGASTG